MDFIPQIQPWIDGAELAELKKVLDSGFISENAATLEFERLIREFTGAKHALAYANGTLALAASLMALGIGASDEVIVPDITFAATSNAVILAGATPVLCDVESDYWQISPASMEAKITPKTKAVMPVHLYGMSADMDAIMRIAKAHNLRVIEDAAESIGSRYKGRHVGFTGDLGIISFYPNKTITTAEGAVVLTDNDGLAKEMYRLKNHGRDKKGVFIHDSIGYNFSFSDLHAAVGIAQMKKLPQILEKKKNIHGRYKESFAGMEDLKVLDAAPDTVSNYWFSNIQVPNAAALEDHLTRNKIGSRRFFHPLHKQPCYKNQYGSDADYPNSVLAFDTCLSLPSGYPLTDGQLEFVIKTIKEFYKA